MIWYWYCANTPAKSLSKTSPTSSWPPNSPSPHRRRLLVPSFLPTPPSPLGPTPHLLTSPASIFTSGKSNPHLFLRLPHLPRLPFHASLTLVMCVFEIKNLFFDFHVVFPIGQKSFFLFCFLSNQPMVLGG